MHWNRLWTTLLCLCLGGGALAQQTPPIQPRIQETPLPPPVELPAPPSVPQDVPNRPLTAEEAVRIALFHQPAIAQARAGVSAAQGVEQQARAGLLPSVGLSTGYNGAAANNPSNALPGSSSGTSGYQLSGAVRQLIYDFNHTRYLAREAAERTRFAGAVLTGVQADLVLQVKQAFYTCAQNERLVDVNAENVRNRQGHLSLAKARLNAGVGLPSDVVRAEAALANAILGLTLARNQSSVSRVNLALLMGIDPRTPLQTAESGEPAVATDDVDALVQCALTQRPEIQQARLNVRAADYGAGAARTGNAPSIAASAGYNLFGAQYPPGNNSLSAGLTLTFTPFDSGLTAGRVQTAEAALVAAQSRLESTRLAVISDVSQAYLNLRTAEQRVVTARAEVANAQESLRLTTGRYQAGLGAFIDVLDAQAALLTASTNQVNAASAVDQARAALVRAVGMTSVDQCLPES